MRISPKSISGCCVVLAQTQTQSTSCRTLPYNIVDAFFSFFSGNWFEMEKDVLQVQILESSTARIPCGPAFLLDVICDAGSREHVVFKIESAVYFLLLQKAGDLTTEWGEHDAVNHCTHVIHRCTSSTFCLFKTSKESADLQSMSEQTIALSLISMSNPASASVSVWPSGSRLLPAEHDSKLRWPFTRVITPQRQKAGKVSFFGSLFISLIVFAVFRLGSFIQNKDIGIWQRYDTSGSIGPRYQLQFDHHNVSSWEARYPKPEDTWFLRIDDQAMIPLSLVDDKELHYQRWFQTRYPEADQIRLNGDYLKQSFLSDYKAIRVPADKTFHLAHCVMVVRRYWWARESGHHVCPRDIDFKHIQHCLDALDSWAFPEGPRRSLPLPSTSHGAHGGHSAPVSDNKMSPGTAAHEKEYFVDENDGTRLRWITKVCFDP